MKNLDLKTLAAALLVLLFFMPLIATLMLSAGASAETKQYDGLQAVFMGLYNVPFLLVSLIGLVVGRSSKDKLKVKTSNIWLSVSISSSIIGSTIMFVWGLGSL